MKWLLIAPLLLVACAAPTHERISGMVTVLESHTTYQYVSVETISSVRAVRISPPFAWVSGQCYTLTIIDAQQKSDGTSDREPYAVNMMEGGC